MSVIIPTFNRPASLAACLVAVAKQDFPAADYEILIVDDGGTPPVKRPLAAKIVSPEIVFLAQENAGPASARNRGAQAAKGRLLVFVDDDCRPHPDWLSRLWRAHDQAPQAVLAGHSLNALPDNPFATASETIVDYLRKHWNADRRVARFLTSNNLAVPRHVFASLGGFDRQFRQPAGEDRFFAVRCRQAGVPLHAVPDARVEHAHAMGLRGFWRQQVNYGRAARRCLAEERALPDNRAARAGFYRGLLLFAWRRHRDDRRFTLVALVVLSQVAIAVGYGFSRWFGAVCGKTSRKSFWRMWR